MTILIPIKVIQRHIKHQILYTKSQSLVIGVKFRTKVSIHTVTILTPIKVIQRHIKHQILYTNSQPLVTGVKF